MKLIVKDIPTNFPIIVRMIFQRTSIWNPAPSEPYPENWWEFQNSVGLGGDVTCRIHERCPTYIIFEFIFKSGPFRKFKPKALFFYEMERKTKKKYFSVCPTSRL